MTPREWFDLWAPADSAWARWAKPVLFTQVPLAPPTPAAPLELPSLDIAASPHTAVVVDLPGALAVRCGLSLAQAGYQPVPLFNGVRAPAMAIPIVDTAPIELALLEGAALLPTWRIPPDAPPAFLLDARRRQSAAPLSPGRFDNRWVVFPQDFPSATFLRSRRIERVLVIHPAGQPEPAEDLAHVLRRWQEAGLLMTTRSPGLGEVARHLEVARPSHFRALWQRVLVVAGLRRNSAGGFGGLIPQPSSG